ncbi:zinc finger protein basonuclin-2 isoform X3 [Lingula anatina]|uniref:Zinc finger protein basonuclin-2 isoform X3 n=1 Tax=Lingula anatina TaxID=7574 RepID=A0A1S3K9G8_LINAN|nr:zinc finger protein basonuclin-2 isoform X3 [Lingula anatina]|eukprot:XP_013419142.1 zinc finger protein basonuclin-2 isoform X3 [Lingula anatina]
MDTAMTSPVQFSMNQATIRCTVPSCACECFSPGKNQLRVCDTCKHGWVAHALDKLGYRHAYHLGMQVEMVQPNIVFDIASLLLYGAQATPIRLKILLDRLFSVLQHEEVLQVLHGFGWSYEDYARGYILQPIQPSTDAGLSQIPIDPNGHVLDKWTISTREEEQVILQQFLRFGETRAIAQEIILQDSKDRGDFYALPPKTESEIKKFIERTGSAVVQSYMRTLDAQRRHLWGTMGYSMPAFPPTRMMSPQTLQQSHSPNSSVGGFSRPSSIPPQATSPESSSPLGRLQTMQPYDYRKERHPPSSAVTASTSETPEKAERRPASLPERHPSPPAEPLALTTSPVKPPPPQQLTPPQLTPIQQMIQGSMLVTSTPLQVPLAVQAAFQPKQEVEAESAINYSMKSRDSSPNTSSSVYSDRKVRHLRKSANPMKRNWAPTQGYGGTLISPSGKKRVLCTACNKTFCDKGALKIHYSAVHLKEMHKCTVDGCNMMFSSRRSRNRHSANPNPKLHMPQKPRKMPEGAVVLDEVSSGGMMDSPQSLPLNPPPLLYGSDYTPSTPDGSKNSDGIPQDLSSGDQAYYVDANNRLSLLPPQSKKPRLKEEEEEEDEVSSNEGAVFPSPVVTSTTRINRRKSNVPTRCAQPTEDTFVMSDDNDNSNDEMNEEEEEERNHRMGDDNQAHGSFSKRKTIAGNEKNSDESQDIADPSSPLGTIQVKQEPRNDAYEDHRGSNNNSFQQEKGQDEGITAGRNVQTSDEKSDEKSTSEYDKQSTTASTTSETGDTVHFLDDSVNDEEEEEGGEDPGNVSEQESDLSFTSNDPHSPMDGHISADDNMNLEDIIDKDNPRKCAACGKIFQNHFSVKTHYQNVHLKLMHTCTVEGCNAAFPSKRSRDRHSANLNLHRKLLSTSAEVELDNDENALSLREEFLNHIYENHTNTQKNGELKDDITAENGGSAYMLRDHLKGNNADMNGKQSDHSYSSNDGKSPNHVMSPPSPDPDGSVRCHICKERFRDNLILKEHYEKVHPREMFKCTIGGCDKIFSTRKSRNRHSQNENLHRHLSPTKTNGH